MFSLCFTFILIALTPYVHGLLEHRYGPRDTIVRVGETVTLYCAFNNKGAEDNVFWYRARIGHVLSTNSHVSPELGRYLITGNHSNGEYNLQITQVQKTDSDEYRCGFDKEPQHDYLAASLWVMVPPSVRYPVCISMTERSKIGQITRLSCVSNGGDPPATLTWKRNGVLIETSVPKEQRNELSHLMTEEDVGATFTCVADSRAMTETRSCSLTPLRELPSIMVLPRVMYTSLGESVTFKCQKQNQQPHDSYSWYFNDKHIVPNERFHLSSDRKTLTIERIVAADNDAEIICKVYNSTVIIEGATATLSISDLSTSTNSPNNRIATLTAHGGNLHYVPPSNGNSKTALIAVSIIGGIAIAMLACIFYIYLQKKIHRKQTVIPMTPRQSNSSRAFSIRSFSARSFSIRSLSGRSFLLRRNSSFKNGWRRNASVPNASVGSYVALNIANKQNDKYEDLRSVASCPSFSLNGHPLSRSISAFALPLPPINPSSSPLSFRAPSHCSDTYMPMHNSIASVAISEDDREDAESCDTYEIIDDKMLEQIANTRTDENNVELDEDITTPNYCMIDMVDNGNTLDSETPNNCMVDLEDNGNTLDSKTSTVGSKSSRDYLEILP